MEKLNSQLVKDLSDALSRDFKVVFIYKPDSKFMKFIGWFVKLFKIATEESWLNEIGTTVFNFVWLPFKIGEVNKEWPLSLQVAFLVHETVHVTQFQEDFFVNLKYLSSDKRAKIEAEAYKSNLQLDHFFNNSSNIDDYMYMIKQLYKLNPEQLKWMESYFRKSFHLIENGISVSPVALYTIHFMKSY